MQLILSRLTQGNSLKIELSIPKIEASEAIEGILFKIISYHKSQGCFEETVVEEEGNFVNYLFEIPSDLHPDGCELVMITAILDHHENPKIFEKDFNVAVGNIKDRKDIYHAFYKPETPSQMKYVDALSQLHKIMDALYNSLEKRMAGKTGLAQILILGIQAVGKTTIIQRMIKGDFVTTRPTLAPQVLKLVYEQIDMQVYDVGGQKKLRERWGTVLRNPHAIIYVIDMAGDEAKHTESQEEFERIMSFFFIENPRQNLPQETPVLILMNKLDLNDSMQEEIVSDLYDPSKYMNNFGLYRVSAKTGDGLLEAFQWLAKQIKVARKF